MPRPRLLLTAGLVAALAAALTGCSSSEDTASAGGTGGTAESITVSTDQGEVEVPADPERVVVLNSNLAGYVYALDVPVHATIPERPGPGGGDDYPEVWADEADEDGTILLPWPEEGFNLEAIAAEDPDLIVGGGQGFPAFQATETYDQLAEIAPTVLVSSSLLSWQEQLSFLAEVFDAADREAELVAAYDDRVEEVSAAITLPPTPVGYLVITADGTPYSLPETASLPQTLAELGFEPATVIADNPDFETYGTGDSFELSVELVGQVLTAPTLFTFAFNADTIDVPTLAQDPIYGALPAFASGNAYELPYWAYRADYLRTMDLLDAIEEQFS
jgi:iron complex transport system substrate-binding protein